MSASAVIGTSTDKEINRLFRGKNRTLAPAAINIINELKDYWPLTVRQVYYQCLSRLLIKNKPSAYQAMSVMLATLRRNDLLPWSAIEDRTRRITDKRGLEDLRAFIQEQSESFLNWRYYHRCRVQEQHFYLEAATEKDALSSIMEEVVWPYCCRLNVCKGQVSATMIEQMARRFQKARTKGQTPILLYFGDLDPSGVAIPKAIKQKLPDHHHTFIYINRVALNPDQLDIYDLPISPDAAKQADPNYGKWIDEYGDTPPTELDALHPKDLKALVNDSIQEFLDMDSFHEQMEIEADERNQLKKMRRDVFEYARNQYPALFPDVQQ